MSRVWVTDAAAVTALGSTLDDLWHGLLAGRSAIGPVSRFGTANYNSRLAACIDDLRGEDGTSLLYDLLDRLLAQLGPVPADCVLITATTKGCLDSLERLSRGLPARPADVPVGAVLDHLQRKLGLAKGGINISAACASSAIAVGRGAARIDAGRAEAVLVVCMDLVTEFVFSGFSALQALSPRPCRPFDRDRSGLTLGEGAAAVLMMTPERARLEGRRPLGAVLGWGAANDANHITAPARDASGLIRAVRQALVRTGARTDDITAVSAHGTGTVYNDLMELTAFGVVFDGRVPPVYGVKGAIGHTLGAAGGIEVALGLRTLREQIVPPTVGLEHPEAGALGLVSREAAPIAGDLLLTTNSGFGGINAATILGRILLP